jgi:hypothetical protein
MEVVSNVEKNSNYYPLNFEVVMAEVTCADREGPTPNSFLTATKDIRISYSEVTSGSTEQNSQAML